MISVCILTKNAEATLKRTLESVRGFSEVIVLDTGSTDQTLAIAAEYPNVKIAKTVFKGFGPLRNEAASLASSDWILALDSDEALSPRLLQEIGALSLDSSVAYSLPRHNYYRGKRIYGCGWNPERVSRLYHRKLHKFSNVQVHEALIAAKEIRLAGPIHHVPYRSTADFLAKMQHYSTLFAEQYKGKRSSSFWKALLHGAFAFFRSYIIKRGIFDGAEGFVISLYNGNTAFYKYLKLMEANRTLSRIDVAE